MHVEAVTVHTSPAAENIEDTTAHVAAVSAHTVPDIISTPFDPTATAHAKMAKPFFEMGSTPSDPHRLLFERGFNPSDQHRSFASVTETE